MCDTHEGQLSITQKKNCNRNLHELPGMFCGPKFHFIRATQGYRSLKVHKEYLQNTGF